MTYLYILKGHQKGVEQKGVFKRKTNFEFVCVCKSTSSIIMVYPMQVRLIFAQSRFGKQQTTSTRNPLCKEAGLTLSLKKFRKFVLYTYAESKNKPADLLSETAEHLQINYNFIYYDTRSAEYLIISNDSAELLQSKVNCIGFGGGQNAFMDFWSFLVHSYCDLKQTMICLICALSCV